MSRDWVAWHRDYDAPTPLARRLEIVRAEVARAITERAGAPICVLSLCSGDGRDLIGPLSDLGRGANVSGRLVELDPTLAGRARSAIANAGLEGLDVLEGDAGLTTSFAGAVPADLVLACGIFGNISEADIERTVRALPTVCATNATVIWTRHRRPPDRTPKIRRLFAASGFRHEAFIHVPDSPGSVGVERFVAARQPFRAGVRLFEFAGA
jgi:hypothetical protein